MVNIGQARDPTLDVLSHRPELWATDPKLPDYLGPLEDSAMCSVCVYDAYIYHSGLADEDIIVHGG